MEMKLSDTILLDILSYSSGAIAVYEDETLKIRFANEKMTAYFGADGSVVGKSLCSFFADNLSHVFYQRAKCVWETGVTFNAKNIAIKVCKDGKVLECFFDMELRAFINEKGETYALLHCCTEVFNNSVSDLKDNKGIENILMQQLYNANLEFASWRGLNVRIEDFLSGDRSDPAYWKLIEDRLTKIFIHEKQLDLALKSAKFGVWTLYLDSSEVYFDDICQSFMGFHELEVLALDKIINAVMPEDRGMVLEEISRAVSGLSDGDYEVTFRVNNLGKSEELWINSKGRVFFDQSGVPIWLTGISRDVTESVLQQRQIDLYNSIIVRKERELRMIIDAAGIGTFSISKNMDEIWFNEHAQKQFGFELGSSLGFKQFLSCFSDKYRKPLHEAFFQLASNNVPMDMLCEIENVQTKASIWIQLVAIQYLDGQQTYIQGILIDLTQAKEEMQRKLDFISIASHELKTPLTTILTFLQLLSQRYHQFEESKKIEMLGQALDQGGRMKNLIEGFLNVSKLQNGQLELDKSVFNFCDLMEKIKAMYEVIQPNNKLYFNTPSCFLVNADMHKVEGVILNFINNAIKYTPVESSVYVTTFIEGAQCGVTVRDQGRGIPIKDQPYIFDKFYRVNQKGGERIQGFGIGLYISAEIVKQHGGRIGLRSTYGKGAEFWFSLPVHRVIEKISYDVGNLN